MPPRAGAERRLQRLRNTQARTQVATRNRIATYSSAEASSRARLTITNVEPQIRVLKTRARSARHADGCRMLDVGFRMAFASSAWSTARLKSDIRKSAIVLRGRE